MAGTRCRYNCRMVFLSVTLVACEKVIQDKEGVYTLVAVIDLLRFKVPPGFPEKQISQTALPISVFANVKTAPG